MAASAVSAHVEVLQGTRAAQDSTFTRAGAVPAAALLDKVTTVDQDIGLEPRPIAGHTDDSLTGRSNVAIAKITHSRIASDAADLGDTQQQGSPLLQQQSPEEPAAVPKPSSRLRNQVYKTSTVDSTAARTRGATRAQKAAAYPKQPSNKKAKSSSALAATVACLSEEADDATGPAVKISPAGNNKQVARVSIAARSKHAKLAPRQGAPVPSLSGQQEEVTALESATQPVKKKKGKVALGQAIAGPSHAQKEVDATASARPAKKKKSRNAQAEAAAEIPPKKKRKVAAAPMLDLPPFPEASHEYEYVTGEEPYRQLGVAVNEAEMLDATVVSRVARAKNVYSREYRAARVVEDKRYAKTNGVGADGKALSKRPDLVARKTMVAAKHSVNTTKTAGHVPGIAIGDRFYLRAEMGVIGMHFSPLGGIDCITKGEFIPGCPGYATSIMVCGGYEDDADDGQELTYTVLSKLRQQAALSSVLAATAEEALTATGN